MKLLIDTHCWLWQLSAPDRLPAVVLDMLGAPENQVHLSAASAWEITIKHGLGKLTLPEAPDRFLPSRLTALGHSLLPVELGHVLRLVGLPALHRDPFDRMLVAQALAEDMDLVTADRLVAAYGARVVWAGS